MNLDSVRRQLDQQRRTLFPDGIVGEVLPQVTRIRGEAGDWHEIAFSSLTEADVEEVIAQQVQHYLALNVEVEWKVYAHDSPPDLRHRLERNGFEMGERETVVVLDLTNRPPWIDAPPPHRVVSVSTPDDLETFRRVAESVFGGSREFIINAMASAIAAGSSQHRGYIVYHGDVPASVGRLYTHPQSAFAGLYGGATLESVAAWGYIAPALRHVRKMPSRSVHAT
jgi:hypothetical protein